MAGLTDDERILDDPIDAPAGFPRATMLVALIGRDGKRIGEWTEATFERVGERTIVLAEKVTLPPVRESVWTSRLAVAVPDGQPITGLAEPYPLGMVPLVLSRRLHPDDTVALEAGNVRITLD